MPAWWSGEPASPTATKRTIFRRYHYTCRLCGLETVDVEVLNPLSRAFPEDLPNHPAWKQGVASPVLWTHTASLEHVVPIARGGEDEPSNLATSCYACNDARSDLLLEELHHPRPADPADEPPAPRPRHP